MTADTYPMNLTTWKETVRAALVAALDRNSVARVAEKSGMSAQYLYDFRGKKASINDENLEKLANWLIANDFLAEPAARPIEAKERIMYEADMTCPECGEPVPGRSQGMLWCGKCGAVLGHVCPKCDYVDSLEANFCAKCGTAMTEPARIQVEKDKAELEALVPKPREPRKPAKRKKGEIEY